MALISPSGEMGLDRSLVECHVVSFTSKQKRRNMTPPTMLCCSASIAKENLIGPIFCPKCCGDDHSPHGHYKRYIPDTTKQISVPRFCCKNASCSRKTFSILPFPCLRYKRHTLAFFLTLAILARAQIKICQLACQYKTAWTVMSRLVRQANRMESFFATERVDQAWGLCPCRTSDESWTTFTMDQFRATVPDCP